MKSRWIEHPRALGSISRLGNIQHKALQQCRAFLLWALLSMRKYLIQ
jgi:hypothetical protein